MSDRKVPTAYSSLRILIEITSFVWIAGAAILLALTLRNAEFAFFNILAGGKILLSMLATLILRGLAQALLDIADAQRRRE